MAKAIPRHKRQSGELTAPDDWSNSSRNPAAGRGFESTEGNETPPQE
jgi:hypothetical protein